MRQRQEDSLEVRMRHYKPVNAYALEKQVKSLETQLASLEARFNGHRELLEKCYHLLRSHIDTVHQGFENATFQGGDDGFTDHSTETGFTTECNGNQGADEMRGHNQEE